MATWNRSRNGTSRSRLGSTATGTSALADPLPGVHRLNSRDSANSWSSKDVVCLLRSSLRNGASKETEAPEEMSTILEDHSPNQAALSSESHAAVVQENGFPKSHNVTFNNQRSEWRALKKLNSTVPPPATGSLRAGCTPSCLKSSQITRSLSETCRGVPVGGSRNPEETEKETSI